MIDRAESKLGVSRPVFCLFWLACAALAIGSALPYAGSWNDGSRLASIEAIVDHHTLAIDDSIFVNVPSDSLARGLAPYHDPGCLAHGTYDKLYIDGHYYSDKPAVISLLMALLYQVWQWFGGPSAALRPDLFCRFLTWGTCGVAYLTTLVCLYRLCRRINLTPRHSLLLCAAMAFGTVGLVYARHVNNHLLLLAVSAALMLNLIAFAQENDAGVVPRRRLFLIGGLAGLGYALDLGLGPVLLLSLTAAIFWRSRSLRHVFLLGVGALPLLAAHHALNYAVGGTLKPMNMVPEYSMWDGCPFNPTNMTGFSRHSGGKLLVYATSLLYGKQGLLGYNLPLLLALVGGVFAWRKLRGSRPEIAFALLWMGGGWLMYAALSNNYGGVCCSIRWFVPFLAPGFYLIALLIRERPTYAWDLAILSAWGALLTALLWERGPWSNRMLFVYWPIQAAALTSWFACRRWRHSVEQSETTVSAFAREAQTTASRAA